MNINQYLLISFSLFHNTASFGLPDASFTVNDTTGCAPLTVYFTNTSTGASFYYWDFGDGGNSSQANPVHTYYFQGDFTVVLWADDSLTNYDSAMIVIHVPGEGPFAVISPVQACPGQTVQFFIGGNYNAGNIYYWDAGDGFTSNSGFFEHSFSNPGLYSVISIIDNPTCGVVYDTSAIAISSSLIPTVHVHPEFADTSICPGERFPFFYDENLPVFWDFGDGTTATDPYPVHFYDSAGIYTVTISVINLCGNTATLDTVLYVSALAVPRANIYIQKNILCVNEPLIFSATGGLDYNYSWNFGDGDSATGKKVTHSYGATGNYLAELTAANSCGNSIIKSAAISVTDTLFPAASIFISEKEICPGSEVTFNASGDNILYEWFFGDGDTSNYRFTEHSYSTTGTYSVQLVVTNFCGNNASFFDTVVISDTVIQENNFSHVKNGYCPGESVQFVPSDTTGFKSFYWDFGDGYNDSSVQVNHVYSDTGIFTVTMIAVNFCNKGDTVRQILRIDTVSLPFPAFDILPGSKFCPGTPVQFVNMSSDTNYCTWFFGNGDSSINASPIYSYITGGNYPVTLRVTNSCGKTSILTKTVTVTGPTPSSPLLSCASGGDTISVSWTPVENASGYEVSTDGGLNWVSVNVASLSYAVMGNDTVTFMVRATGNNYCAYGETSQPVTCLKNLISFDIPDIAIAVFPLPVSDVLYLSPGRNNALLEIIIYNLYGQMIYTGERPGYTSCPNSKTAIFDFREFPDGFYILKITAEEGLYYFRVLHCR